jgi:diacylglycerol kinase (ATP)
MLHAREARDVALVVNASARRGAAALERAAELLGQAGFSSLLVLPVRTGAELAETLERVLSGAPDLLVVGGGDGTVSCAADKVAGTDVTIGVLPLGTANDFARTLQIPGGLDEAVFALVSGRVVDVDLGRVNGRGYLNVASMGLSVAVTERLTPGLKRRLGPLAYPVALVRAYRRHRPFRARLEFPDGDRDPLDLADLLQLAVGNGRHYGAGNTVSPWASVDDHLLDVAAIEHGRLSDHVSIARFLRNGKFVEHDKVHHARTRRLRVATDTTQPINVDGEIVASTPATFEVERDAVRVVAPLGSRAARLDRWPA